MTVDIDVATPEAMRGLGERLATILRSGDLVVLDGPLGAGKTTLAQGIGAGLGIRGDVTSPTFVIARVHPSLAGGRRSCTPTPIGCTVFSKQYVLAQRSASIT